MQEKILKVNENPILNTYNYYGSLMSMISDDPNIWPWFHSLFVQVVYCQEGNWYFFENGNDQQLFDQCWRLEKHSLPNHILQKYQFFVEFVKESIDNEYFVLANLDNYYIEVSSPFYKQYHFIHEALIYGYDLNKNIVYIADNFKNGKYVYTACSSDNLDLAFSKVSPSESAVFLYRKKESDYSIFNFNYVVHSLYCYKNSVSSLQVPNVFETRKYGLSVLQQMIQDIQIKKLDGNALDIRAYHLQYEHKKCMVLMLAYMIDNGYLSSGEECLESYKKLTSEVLLLRNYVIKYNLSKKLALLDTIEQKLEGLLKIENQIVDELLQRLT